MKKLVFFMFSAILAGSLIIPGCNSQVDVKTSATDTTANTDDPVKRGEYLVTIMGCDDCHTPKKFGPNGPELDMENRLAGHPAQMPLGPIDSEELKSWVLFNQTTTAFVGPWGISYSANLTSDATGIGSWTEQQFMKSIREGKYKGLDSTRPILPPMPWTNFSKATDDDLKSIFAFLKSTRAVTNVVPAAVAPDKIASIN